MGKVTINDVARISGFSKSTVSCALNNKEGVGEEARQEIIKLAKSLGYTPNYFARKISSRSYKTIGVILRDLTNPFYANVFCAIDKLAEENGFETIFYNLGGDSSRMQKGINLMQSKMVSGIILDFFGHDEKVTRELAASSIPTVIFGLNVPGELSCVQTDDGYGAERAVDYGYECGHRNIYYIARGGNDIFDTRRADCVKDRCARYGLPFDGHVITMPQEGEVGEIIAKSCPPDSLLICYNDVLACNVIRSLMKSKRYVPDDYSVIGFDNLSVVPYSLTTVDIPQYKMAVEAFNLLKSRIEGDTECRKITLNAELIVRDSVKNLDEK